MRPGLNLNWIRSFEAAARLQNFTEAGQELGMTQVGVSQHIRLLEKTSAKRCSTACHVASG